MVEELIRKLLESGVHFGHQTHRWNPKMKPYIFGQRSGIYIINLEKTAENLNQAREFVYDIAAKGGKFLFVGTKKQAQMIVEEEAQKAEMYYVNNRWLGGLLTNFQTVRKSIERLNTIEEMHNNGIWENLKKKEIARLTKEKERLLRDLGGIRELKDLPDVIYIVDPKKEEIAVLEAKKLGIPIVAIVDTNCNPEEVEYPIPGNDDALKAIRFITSLISESIIKGRKEYATNAKAQEQINSEGAAPEAETSAESQEEEKKEPVAEAQPQEGSQEPEATTSSEQS